MRCVIFQNVSKVQYTWDTLKKSCLFPSIFLKISLSSLYQWPSNFTYNHTESFRMYNMFLLYLAHKGLDYIWTIISNKLSYNVGKKICSADSDSSRNRQIPKCCTAFVCQPTEVRELRASRHLVIHLETSALQTQYSDGVSCLLSRKHSSVHREPPCVLL